MITQNYAKNMHIKFQSILFGNFRAVICGLTDRLTDRKLTVGARYLYNKGRN